MSSVEYKFKGTDEKLSNYLCRSEDELVLLARGLGLLRLVTNLLHSYDAAGNNLIVVVGADERENGWIGEGTLGAVVPRGKSGG